MKQVEYYKNGNRTLRIKYEGIKKLLEKQDKEIERLNNIIKNAREYIKDACYLDEINYPNSLGHKQTMKLLEILDKVDKGE